MDLVGVEDINGFQEKLQVIIDCNFKMCRKEVQLQDMDIFRKSSKNNFSFVLISHTDNFKTFVKKNNCRELDCSLYAQLILHFLYDKIAKERPIRFYIIYKDYEADCVKDQLYDRMRYVGLSYNRNNENAPSTQLMKILQASSCDDKGQYVVELETNKYIGVTSDYGSYYTSIDDWINHVFVGICKWLFILPNMKPQDIQNKQMIKNIIFSKEGKKCLKYWCLTDNHKTARSKFSVDYYINNVDSKYNFGINKITKIN